jgi:hypothetical protein
MVAAFLCPPPPPRRARGLPRTAARASRHTTAAMSLSRRGLLAASSLAALGAVVPAGAARAGRPEGVRRPDLLPAQWTPVIDLERWLAPGEERRLAERLVALEQKRGWKVRVLTQRYPVTPGLAVQEFWGVDDRTVVLVADYFSGGGSLLHFSVGDAVYQPLPPRFWSLLTSEVGNRFYVQKHGEDGAILAAVDAIRTCLLSNGCKVPPSDAGTVLRKD